MPIPINPGSSNHLPGDIRIESENGHFYFPLTTCVLVSAALSLAIWLVRLFRG